MSSLASNRSLNAAENRSSSSCNASASEKKAANSHKVLVIGAGAAGISAANKLVENGCEVTVLEARNRIGGRIHTDRSLSKPVDLGAGWIHGNINNPLSALAEKYKADLKLSDFNSLVAYDDDGTDLTAKAYDLSIKYVDLLNRKPINSAIGSFGNFIRKNLEITSDVDERLINALIGALSVNFGYDLGGIEWSEARRLKHFEGGDWRFENGYDTLTNSLAAPLDIRKSVRVKAIDTSGPYAVVDTDTGIFEADSVIVTVPLSVLKSGAIKFLPELPVDQADAIASLKFGMSEKMVLEFPKAFWPVEPTILLHGCDNNGDFPLFFNNHLPFSGTPILTGRVVGEHVPEFLDLTEEGAVAKMMSVLTRIFGKEIPDPVGVLRTDWLTDPFSLGAYSHERVDVQSARLRSELTKPVNAKLHFAGEHTEPDYPSTVHGAYMSGSRAADQLLAGMVASKL